MLDGSVSIGCKSRSVEVSIYVWSVLIYMCVRWHGPTDDEVRSERPHDRHPTGRPRKGRRTKRTSSVRTRVEEEEYQTLLRDPRLGPGMDRETGTPQDGVCPS